MSGVSLEISEAAVLDDATFDRLLRRTPFRRAGRQLGPFGGIDCTGVVMARLLQRHGVELLDPWRAIAADWAARQVTPGTCMPSGWQRVDGPPRDGDVAFRDTARLSVGVVDGGCLWTAIEDAGVVALPLARERVMQLWRREGAVA
jgi:hypothetical protein